MAAYRIRVGSMRSCGRDHRHPGGSEQAQDGDWVIKSERGEQWPMPEADFELNYEGPLPRTED